MDGEASKRDAAPRSEPARVDNPEAQAIAARHDGVYRGDIDGLRAIAVLAVVAFHAFPSLVPGGFVGVDVFFVISGYLISGLIRKRIVEGRFTFADFYVRRAKRILPALLLVLAACYVFGWSTLLPGAFAKLGKHTAAGIAFISNFALWSEAGYFDTSAMSKPLLHLWSLGIEEQFYLIWPLALWWASRWRRGALVMVLAIGTVSFAINLATVESAAVAAFYSPVSRFWELQLGCLMAVLAENTQTKAMSRVVAEALSIAGAFALIFAIIFDEQVGYPGRWALLPTGGACMLIASGSQSWLGRHVLSNRLLVGIGLVSYPLYLWHWPLLSFASISAFGTPSVGVRVGLVLASIALAVATYFFVEKPIRFGTRLRHKIAALAAVSLVLATVGVATFLAGGVPSRFPANIRALADFKYEDKTDARYANCWLDDYQPFDAFAQDCTDLSSARPRVVVWGDSHAARFYPGLAAVLGDTVALSQFTRSGCPPVVDLGNELCHRTNAWVVSQIALIRPDTVVLFAYWPRYTRNWASDDAKRHLFATIDALHAAGTRKVLVMGPAPQWKAELPELLYRASSRNPHGVPDRLATDLDPRVATADTELRHDLEGRDAAYFSVRNFLCTEEGCLTHTPEGEMSLTTYDYGHLTTAGAAFITRQIAAEQMVP